MEKSLIHDLQGVVGAENIDASEEALLCHAYDATQIRHRPDLILYPRSTEQVSRILARCFEAEVPVYPRGAGSGFAGGSVPIRGGVALVMTRMNRILDIHAEDLCADVEPGVVNASFREAVEARGLFYPPDPGSLAFSTLGGNLATGAGGPRSLKYGVTRDYVLGLEAVLADGRVTTTGVRTLKGVVGYDLTRLLVGSEGTLAVVTRITLRLIPRPQTCRTALAVFPHAVEAGRAVAAVIAAPVIPAALEFMDRSCMEAVEERFRLGLPVHGDAYLLIEVDGGPEETDREILQIQEICRNQGALEMIAAGDAAEGERLWKARRSISQAINRMGLIKINEDIAVPRSRIPEMLGFLDELARREGLRILTFGHAGDGNLHVNILTHAGDRPRAEASVEAIFEEVLRLQGTLSAEHGVGLTKKAYLGMEIPPPALWAMRKIKEALDPRGILNPGKLFPRE